MVYKIQMHTVRCEGKLPSLTYSVQEPVKKEYQEDIRVAFRSDFFSIWEGKVLFCVSLAGKQRLIYYS